MAFSAGDRLSVDERHALIARALGGLTAQETHEHLPSLIRAASSGEEAEGAKLIEIHST